MRKPLARATAIICSVALASCQTVKVDATSTNLLGMSQQRVIYLTYQNDAPGAANKELVRGFIALNSVWGDCSTAKTKWGNAAALGASHAATMNLATLSLFGCKDVVPHDPEAAIGRLEPYVKNLSPAAMFNVGNAHVEGKLARSNRDFGLDLIRFSIAAAKAAGYSDTLIRRMTDRLRGLDATRARLAEQALVAGYDKELAYWYARHFSPSARGSHDVSRAATRMFSAHGATLSPEARAELVAGNEALFKKRNCAQAVSRWESIRPQSAAARNNLGLVYLYGCEGVEKRPAEGQLLLQQAANDPAPDVAAMLNLAEAHLNGTLAPGDPAAAKKLLTDAYPQATNWTHGLQARILERLRSVDAKAADEVVRTARQGQAQQQQAINPNGEAPTSARSPQDHPQGSITDLLVILGGIALLAVAAKGNARTASANSSPLRFDQSGDEPSSTSSRESGSRVYEVERAVEQIFTINGNAFKAKSYCSLSAGDRVTFASGSPYGACASATLVDLRSGHTCEVWCQ